MDVTALIVAMSIPSAITGFCFWMLQNHLEKREKRQDEKEAAREKNEILMVKASGRQSPWGKQLQRLYQGSRMHTVMVICMRRWSMPGKSSMSRKTFS